jgi:hypothetical protein
VKPYRRAAVASTFSPTFAAVLAEAGSFSRHCEASLDVLHAAARTEEKETRFRKVLGDGVPIRWVENESPSAALLSVADDYELLIAGALQREDGDRPFTSSVARDLLRCAPCDLLLVPRPVENPEPPAHVVLALEPGDEARGLLERTVRILQPKRATIAVTQTPFAAAIAASRGEEPTDLDAWLEGLAGGLEDCDVELDERVVRSNTGYSLCDTVEGLQADLLIVQAHASGSLPLHMNWLFQVIPTRLLVVRG